MMMDVYTGQSSHCTDCSLITFPSLLTPQNGDSAVIQATVGHHSGALRELVRSGADLNLQNQVRYTVTVDTALHHVSFHIRRVSLLL